MKRNEPEEGTVSAADLGNEAKHRKVSNEESETVNHNNQNQTLESSEVSSNQNTEGNNDTNAVPSNDGMDVDKDHDKDVANQLSIKAEPNGIPPLTEEAPSSNTANAASAQADDRNNKQKHAMEFLYKVRLHYSKSPTVYNSFLEIMKDFKSGAIDTPLVINRVKELFKGNNWLIQEFNAFLPPGFRIDVDDQPQAPVSPPPQASTPTSPNVNNNASTAPPAPTSPAAVQPPLLNGQTDLEHARNYVRKIKNRFALQPHIYKTFLEILHSYYQGNHTINDVLEEVAELFQNHQDLLEEFKHFLPKSIGDNQTYASAWQQKKPKKKGGKTERPPPPVVEKPPKPVEERRSKPHREIAALLGDDIKERENTLRERRAARREIQRPPIRRITRDEIILPRRPKTDHVCQKEDLFKSLKQGLTPSLFKEFLRVSALYSQDIVSKNELVSMIKDLLASTPQLLEQFRVFIGDLKASEVKKPGETTEKEVKEYMDRLREDEGEDELYELDTMLELNNAAMRELEKVLEKSDITTNKPELESIDILHIRTVERMYGDRASEVIDALFTHPAAVLPVILKRLRQRNQAWAQIKKEIQKSVYPPISQQPTQQEVQTNGSTSVEQPPAQTEPKQPESEPTPQDQPAQAQPQLQVA